MVKMQGPLMSLTAHGWLGRSVYGHRQYRDGVWKNAKGVVPNPYPIGLLGHINFPYKMQAWGLRPFFPFISAYYSNVGWEYEMRRTWHGIIPVAKRPAIYIQRNTALQYAYKMVFADAVRTWQSLDQYQKRIFNTYRIPVHASGYNRFIRLYLRDNLHGLVASLLLTEANDYIITESQDNIEIQ